MPTKKSAAKKAPAKKAATKRAPVKRTAEPAVDHSKDDNTPKQVVEEPPKRTMKHVARELHNGSQEWGTGRERDRALEAQGYDLRELRIAQRDLRAKELGSGD